MKKTSTFLKVCFLLGVLLLVGSGFNILFNLDVTVYPRVIDWASWRFYELGLIGLYVGGSAGATINVHWTDD